MVAFNKFGQGYFLFAEFEKSGGEMKVVAPAKRLTCAKKLSDVENMILLDVYQKHNRSMGRNERSKYNLGNIVKVKVAVPGQVIEVYYNNGDWWHYTINGAWY